MSEAITHTPIPQAEFHAEASKLLPWYGTATPEHQAALYGYYAQDPLPVAEFLADAAAWESAVAFLTDAGVLLEAMPAKLVDVLAKYEASVEACAVAESKGHLDVGKWAQAVVDTGLTGVTDLGKRRTRRAELVDVCKTRLVLAGLPSDVDEYLRLWAVAVHYGKPEAKRLGIGKLRAFSPTLYREKDTEVWGFRDSITEAQREILKAVWQMACSTAMSAQAVADEVRVGMGKEVKAGAEKPTEVPNPDAGDKVADPKSAEGKPEANSTPAERMPEVAPENPVECARRMASLPYGRPDSELVWRNFGSHCTLSDKDAAAFVQGLCDAGKLQLLVTLAKSATELAKKLASAPKTVEAARAAA